MVMEGEREVQRWNFGSTDGFEYSVFCLLKNWMYGWVCSDKNLKENGGSGKQYIRSEIMLHYIPQVNVYN